METVREELIIPGLDHLGVLEGAAAFDQTVSIIRPNLPPWENVKDRFQKIYASGMITNHRTVAELEAVMADFLEVREVVALSSCTSGLILALKALGISGEVIVPSFTFSATGHAVFWAGAKPVFVDCDHRDWNISIESIRQAVSPDTAAILAVHIFGNPAPVLALEELARELCVPLLFDAAHGLGGAVGGKRIGGFGRAEIFSLSPTKLLTGGEGGLLATNDETLAGEIRFLRNYGNQGDYDCRELGLNARMTEFNAALVLEGLGLVEGEIRERARLAAVYRKELASLPGIIFQEVPAGNTHTWKDFTLVIEPASFGLDRNQVQALLGKENIQTKKYFYPPLHMQSAYKKLPHRMVRLNVTEWLTHNVLTLPLYSQLEENGIRRIAATLSALHHNAEKLK
ncbi:MAG: DegT/DnrJ/EryC1/StrS family aminotransferase [Candidatus Krumholzibacteriota bacterium]|nr:DegT/DnrJ/EryC1/StrS family aminotransferase [Candidatus Krumholzibacteriota bacterium]